MFDDPTDPQRSRLPEEKLDRIAAELRQIKYLMWFLSCVGVVVVISMLPQLLTNLFYAAVFIAAVAGLWFLASKAAQIPIIRQWRAEKSRSATVDRDA
jgi:hypothetical protein